MATIAEFPSSRHLQGQYQNDLSGLLFDNDSPDKFKIPGDYLLEKFFQINTKRSKWVNLSVLFSMIVVYRLIFFIMIKISEDVTPWVRGYIARRRYHQKKSGAARSGEVPMNGVNRTLSLREYATDPAGGK